VAALASAARSSGPPAPIQALDTGPVAVPPRQRTACAAGVACTGPFRLTSTNQPAAAPEVLDARVLTGLAQGQAVEVVLRFDPVAEGYDLGEADLQQPYTAIIRYRSKGGGRARVDVSQAGGGWRPWGRPQEAWPATPASDWEWMQVFPVHVVRPDPKELAGPALKVRISGLGTGEDAPVLDLAGFVSGPPWCLPAGATTFADVCGDGHGDRLPMVRLPTAIGGRPVEPKEATPVR
jgi:hypothetical protein